MRHGTFRLPVAAAILFALAPLVFAQPPSAPADRIASLNQELTTLSTQPREAVLARVRDRIRLRLQAFTELAQTDPARALSLTLPESSLARLRTFAADVADGLESQGEWSGPAEVVAEDDFGHAASRVRLSIHSGGEWMELYPAGGFPDVRSGAIIRSQGFRMGRIIVARGVSVLPRTSGIGCTTTGVQKLAVVMVNFASSSINTSVVNSTTLGAIISGGGHSLTSYWNEASYGQTSATGDVYGPFNLGADYTGSDYVAIQNAAITAAANAGGVNFQNYNHVVIVMPNGFPIAGGLGSIGCVPLTSPTTGDFTAGVGWVRADFTTPNDLGVCGFAHENGHNMGLNHASTESYGSVPLGSFGAVPVHNEYGSYFSLMSLCATINSTTLLGHYDAQHKVALGWFAPSNYQTVSAGGSFTLAPAESTTANLQAIRVQRGLDNNFWLWLEYRQSLGYDTTFSALDSQIYSGAMIHFEDPANQTYLGYTRLLNYTAPSNPAFNEPALAVGSSWSDPYSLLTLSVTSADSAGLHVTVHYDTPCANLTPPSRNYNSSAAVASDSVSVTVTGSCSWTAVSNASWINVTAGSSGTTSGTVTYSLTSNSGPMPRTGTITIARQEFTITQASSDAQPTPVSVTPGSGSSAPGTPQSFVFVYSDGDGAADLTQVSMLINSSKALAGACDVAWVRSDNTIRLASDDGNGYTYGSATGSNSFGNSQCTVSYTNPIVQAGNNVTMTLSIAFADAFVGPKNVYLEAQDVPGADSGLVLLGTWSVGAGSAITVTTSPAGRSIVVDGITLTAPQNFNWVVGSNHTIAATTPQSGAAGTRYVWAAWSDAGALSHSVIVPGTTTTYTANFTTQYLLTASVAPPATGAIAASPASGDGYYNSGTAVQLTATPITGYGFSAFTGDLTGGINPQSVVMSAAHTITANFTSIGTAPSAVSVSPNGGTAATQTFTGVYTAANGYHDLQWVQMLFAVATDGGGQSYCFVHYDVQGNGLWLYGDSGFFVGPITPGTPSNLLQNSLCAVNTSGSTVSGIGATLIVSPAIVFKAAGARNIYMRAMNEAQSDTGFVQRGTWNLTAAALGTMTVSPNSGSGSIQTFTLTYPDPPGFAGAAFGWVQFLVGAASDGGGQPFCFVHYDRAGNGLWMYSGDVGFFLGPVTPGTASSALTSTACSVNTAGATVGNVSGSLVVTVPITMKAPMDGAKLTFQRTLDVLNRDTGWHQSGSWTIN